MANMDLRPMTLGEVLDRTFSLYKGNFWLFAGIVAIPCLLLVFASLLSSSTSTATVAIPATQGFSAHVGYSIGSALGALALFAIVYLLVFTAAQAATVVAVSDLYLGRAASIAEAYRRIRGRFLTVLLAVGLILLLVAAGMLAGTIVSGVVMTPLLLLLGLKHSSPWIFGLAGLLDVVVVMTAMAAVFCHTALAIPVATLEPVRAGGAISRSFRLIRKHAAQVFAVYALAVCVTVITSVVFNVPFLLAEGSIFRPHALPIGIRILQALSSWVASVIAAPIATIAISLIYYNQRVRKEAFDLEQLMASLEPGETPPTLSPA